MPETQGEKRSYILFVDGGRSLGEMLSDLFREKSHPLGQCRVKECEKEKKKVAQLTNSNTCRRQNWNGRG